MKMFFVAAALAATAALAEDKPAAAAAPADKPAAAAPAAEMQMPKPPDELKLEQWFAGTWSCKGMQHAGPMGPEMKTSTKLAMKMDMMGFWLEIHGTAMSGPMKGKEIFEGMASYDGATHQRYDFGPGNITHFTTKGWDGDKVVFDGDSMMMGGQKMAAKHTITRKGDNEFASAFDMDGKPMIEETCTRGAAAKAKK